jgi:hypothetical protein
MISDAEVPSPRRDVADVAVIVVQFALASPLLAFASMEG